ncbi:MAG: glycosyltransferase family 2 protein [Parachlamydiaceae bacterium]
MSSTKVAVIIVTHNSEKHIDKCMDCLRTQTHLPTQIILVDSGSTDCDYLQKFASQNEAEILIGGTDIGFCKGNNLGLTKVLPDTDFLFFLNPDAFITPTFIQKAVDFMNKKENVHCGALTGTTLGYCIETDRPTGLYDTTGVFRTWWGHWYDRNQGAPHEPDAYSVPESIPAICGAVYFCRYAAAQKVMLSQHELFDNHFYMYKEDIDLSLRLKKQGWQLMFVPDLIAFHCRGWNPNRKKMAKKMRLHSAINELRIHSKQKAPIPLIYSLIKYCAVKCFNK